MKKISLKKQSAATFVEYVMILGILLAVFVVIGAMIHYAALTVTKRSIEAVKEDVPCKRSGTDSLLQGDECL